MKDKTLSGLETIVGNKRIEFLLEELVWQTVALRFKNEPEKADERFNNAMINVKEKVESYFSSLPDAE